MSLQAAADKALELEREAGPRASHHELAEGFAKALPNLDPDDPRAQFLRWETWLYEYQLKPPGEEVAQGDELGPLIAWPDGRRHPPLINECPDDVVEYLRHRLQVAENSGSRARLSDFLWLRTRDVAFADRAISEYLDAARVTFQAQFGPMVATTYLIRAVTLSRSLRRDRADLRAAIRTLAEALGSDTSGFLCRLIRSVADEIARDPELTEWCLRTLTESADKGAARGGQERFSERAFLAAAAELAGAKQDRDLVRLLRIRTAHSFELEADERSDSAPLIQSTLLQDAMKSYADLGMSGELQRVKPKLHDASEQAGADLKEISTAVTIPGDRLRQDMQQLIEFGQKRAPWAHLQIFGMRGVWPKWEEVVAFTAEVERRFPLQALVRKVLLGPDGRPLARPSDSEAAREFDEIRRYVDDTQLRLGIAMIEVAILRELNAWHEDLIMQALSSGLLFNAEILAAVQPGILAFERNAYWEALHVLVPQIERVVRELAQLFGGNVYRHVSATGEIQWSSLKTLLQLEPVRIVLARIRPDMADQLKYLLIDSRGMNLRDDVAHGILPHGQGVDVRALLCILILLTLSLPQMATGDRSEAAVE